MKRYLSGFGLMIFLVVLSSCAPKEITKGEAFPKMYAEHPVAILVLPPMNETTAADAKEYYSTTIAEPLSFAGYYVFPIEVVSDMLKAEGLYDTETMLGMPVQKFRDYTGADAVLFIKIKKWDTHYYVLAGNVTVSVDFLLKSTITGAELWKYSGTMRVDTTGDSGGAGGLAGLLIKVIATAAKTAAQDYVPVALRANVLALHSIPFGKYNPSFSQDKQMQAVFVNLINGTNK